MSDLLDNTGYASFLSNPFYLTSLPVNVLQPMNGYGMVTNYDPTQIGNVELAIPLLIATDEQIAIGTITCTGRSLDQFNNPISGVKVKVLGHDLGDSITDVDGYFIIENVPIETYLSFSKAGYETVNKFSTAMQFRGAFVKMNTLLIEDENETNYNEDIKTSSVSNIILVVLLLVGLGSLLRKKKV
jgi:hypothetical protein